MLVNRSGKNRIALQLLVASISFSFQFLAGIVLLNISKHNYINLTQTYIHKVHIILYRSKWSWKPKWFMGSLSDTQAFYMDIENNKRVQRRCNIRYAVDNQLQWILNWNQISYCRTTSCIGNTAHDLLMLYHDGWCNWSLIFPADIWVLSCCLNVICEQLSVIPLFKTLFQITASLYRILFLQTFLWYSGILRWSDCLVSWEWIFLFVINMH